MEREYQKIKDKLKEILPIEQTLKASKRNRKLTFINQKIMEKILI